MENRRGTLSRSLSSASLETIVPAVKKHLWVEAFQMRGSIALQVMPPLMVLVLWTAVVCYLDLILTMDFRLPTSFITLLGVVLGLLLAFRSTQAYDRFYEGRKTWGTLQFQCRNGIRAMMLSFVDTEDGNAACQKAVKMLIAFVFSLKHYLRAEKDVNQLSDMLDVMDVIPISAFTSPGGDLENGKRELNETDPLLGPYGAIVYENGEGMPFKIGYALAKHLQEAHLANLITGPNAGAVQSLVPNLTETATVLERIATSPIPPAYSIHLRQILFIYCFFLPLQLVKDLQWLVILVVFFASYCFLGIEMIARQLEMPFGRERVSDICEKIFNEKMFTVAIAIAPAVSLWMPSLKIQSVIS
ncbi:UPF0187-domain-containing protein [Gonapodya prolifera JEL478]|uniref:UPF0187-domain-containing protein n=1 Tax=Gonapodya prolifera (strain JEL478) TaxID=1344416 RepID=A0A139ABG0_GONPJ|nr:UPF0187-domain-containing protein [Gonapodya prolifera JEL478]|eukprot:KXS14162.1 UPF0187-domain-containing protein [Gonapodya prolifera JEL478]